MTTFFCGMTPFFGRLFLNITLIFCSSKNVPFYHKFNRQLLHMFYCRLVHTCRSFYSIQQNSNDGIQVFCELETYFICLRMTFLELGIFYMRRLQLQLLEHASDAWHDLSSSPPSAVWTTAYWGLGFIALFVQKYSASAICRTGGSLTPGRDLNSGRDTDRTTTTPPIPLN